MRGEGAGPRVTKRRTRWLLDVLSCVVGRVVLSCVVERVAFFCVVERVAFFFGGKKTGVAEELRGWRGEGLNHEGHGPATRARAGTSPVPHA